MNLDFLKSLGIQDKNPGVFGNNFSATGSGGLLEVTTPIDGSRIGSVHIASGDDYEQVMRGAQDAFKRWRVVPAPVRGQIVREIGDAFRQHKEALGKLISLETGKILVEGLGEVQEAIDIADFAVGLSRQLYGNTMHSERPSHRMYEQWHPVGVVGVISAFNFPVAVWAWNSMLAAVCGDVCVWKPSEIAPLSAIATHKICAAVAERNGHPGIFNLVIGDGPGLGQRIAADRRIPVVSATGSSRMGQQVGEVVGKRLGRTILELGGNNAVTVLKDADLKLVIPSTVFGSVGTAGQRCTTTRRLLVEEPIVAELSRRMVDAYQQVRIGNPLEKGTLMGPLIHQKAVAQYQQAIATAIAQGGELLTGGKVLEGNYVQPTIIKAHRKMPIVHEETFAPILYLIPVKDVEEAIEANNEVPQGLSSAIFTRDMQSAERFLAATGSDCGIANVNIGTSGAEIGGAFGGEKDTGGGRESGSDSWRQYMRRQTNTLNWSNELPLAQGIKFDLN